MKEEQYLDIRKILKRIISNKFLILASIISSLTLGWLYLRTQSPVYQVGITLLLNKHGLNDKGTGSEKFINGLELLDNNEELEDAIAILSSYSTIQDALSQLNFEVAYYQYPTFIGGSKFFAREVLNENLSIQLFLDQPQLLGIPIYLSFPTDSTYKIEFEAEKALLYLPQTQEELEKVSDILVKEELPLNKIFESPYLTFKLTVGETLDQKAGYYFTIRSVESLTDLYRRKLSVAPVSKESNVVIATTTGAVVEREEQFLDALSQVYISNDLESKNLLGTKTLAFIDRQLRAISDSLQNAENNLENFRAKYQMVDMSSSSKKLSDQLEILEKEKADLIVQQEYLKFLVNHLTKNDDVSGAIIPNTKDINDPTLSKLVTELSDLNQKKISLQYNLEPNSGPLKVVNQRIAATKMLLIDNLDSRIGANKIAFQDINRRLKSTEQAISRLPQGERNLLNIDRKLTFNDNLYNYLLEKKAEAGIALASNVPDKTVIDSARQLSRQPVSPKKWLVYAVALLIGLTVPLGYILVQDLWNNTVLGRKDLKDITDIPLIGSVTNAPRDVHLVVTKQPNSPAAESFRFIRINLQSFYRPYPPQVIGISSSVDGEGKTFCSANLAANYAVSGKKTLLIAGDLRKPKQHNFFKFANYGLAEYLVGDLSVQQYIQSTHVRNLDILASGKTVRNSAEMLESQRVEQLMTSMKSQYEIIVVDTPPINFVVDYFLWNKHFDITLLVVRQKYTNREMIERATEMLRTAEAGKLALLLNFDDDSSRYKSYHEQQKGLHMRKLGLASKFNRN